MKIAIIGAGAIGSVVAAYLAKAGEEITLVGREDHVIAINDHGLKVKGVRGEEIFKIKAQTKLTEEPDLVVFTVKTQDLEHAFYDNAEFLDSCPVLSTQNGVQADTILSSHFDRYKMYSSIVMFGATYSNPGEVILNFEGDWIVGKPYEPVDPLLHQYIANLSKAFKMVLSHNIVGMKWLKLFVNFNNCICAVVGKSMQETFADLDLCRLSIMLLKEGLNIVKLGNVELISLPEFPVERVYGLAGMPIEQSVGIINKTLTTLSKEPLYGSILQSILRGRDSEIEFINGEVVYMAKQLRMTAPLNAKIVDMVHHVEKTNKFYTIEEVKNNFDLLVQK